MQLPIEIWADDARLPGEAMSALRESCTCYKAGAYRAALVFSYIAWGLVLRRRILTAKSPPGVPQAKWDELQKAMQDDDRWDPAVFDATQTKQPAPFFNVSEDLRVQVRYWKDRRNDSAHSKSNAITSASVESLWDFLRSNLAKFAPGGSLEDLVARFRDHFDPNLTPPGASCEHLVREVPAAVPLTRHAEFLHKVNDLFRTKVGTMTVVRQSPLIQFFETVLRVAPSDVEAAARTFLQQNLDVASHVIYAHPKYTYVLQADPKIVRSFWRTKLIMNNPQSLRVYASLLRQGLIPASEIPEANMLVIKSCHLGPPHDEDIDALSKADFFVHLREHAFVNMKVDRFDWGNPNATIVRWYVSKFALDDEVVSALCSTFNSQYFPNQVQEQLTQLFASDAAKRAEFEAAAKNLGLTAPPVLL